MTEASPLAAPERSALPVMWSAPCGVARRTRYGVPRLAVNSATPSRANMTWPRPRIRSTARTQQACLEQFGEDSMSSTTARAVGPAVSMYSATRSSGMRSWPAMASQTSSSRRLPPSGWSKKASWMALSSLMRTCPNSWSAVKCWSPAVAARTTLMIGGGPAS